MGRMAVVGCEASGKTVFLSALSDLYRPNGKDPSALCLVPENQAANRFAAFQQRQMRSLRQWPPATNPGKTLRMDWTLRRAGAKVVDVSMLEFGGEVFRAAFRDTEEETEHKQAVKALMDYLSSADFIVILVSIKELMRDPGDVSMDQFERDTESLWVTRGILDFLRKELPGVGSVIGLTQADRYSKELAEAGDARRLLSLRWPAVGVLVQDIPVVPIASVSATDEEGRPAEGYTTEGVLPVMREMARQEFGETDVLRAEVAELRAKLERMKPSRDPAAFQSLVKKLSAAVEALTVALALTDGTEGDDLAAARSDLERFRTLSRDLRRKNQKKRETRERNGRLFRAFLRLLLAASVVAAGVSCLLVYEPPKASVDLPPTTNEVAAVTNEVEAVTNEVPAVTEEPTAITNEIPSSVEEDVPTTVEEGVAAVVEEAVASATNEVKTGETKVESAPQESPSKPVPVASEQARQRKQRIFDKCVRDAEAGDAKSKRILAGHYLRGSDFVVQNVERARQLYREAAAAGDAKAMYHVGLEYFETIETDPLSRLNARTWFQKAKSAGCTAADLDELIEQTK